MTVTLLQGDCLEMLKTLPDKCVQTCVTSPPYFGLRDYGVDGQIGLEPMPEEYVQKLVSVFREVRRVLADDGVVWINLGDSYAANGARSNNNGEGASTMGWPGQKHETINKAVGMKLPSVDHGLKPKDLIGIPWRVAFALQADGWYLRQDIIWAKPNPMPESVTDRCTKSHEYIFLLSKQARYYYDNEAVKEPFADERMGNPGAYKWTYANDPETGKGIRGNGGGSQKLQSEGWNANAEIKGRNKRSVWTMATKPYREAHFATYPEELITPCILAGSRRGDTVLDPFNGSGTTGAAALRHGRKYIGIDINEEYLEMTKRRIAKVQPPLILQENEA